MTDSRGGVMPLASQCGAKKKNGEPCRAPKAKGGTRCRRHGGASPRSQEAAKKRLAAQELEERKRAALKTLGYPVGKDIDPGQALLDEIQFTHAHVLWLRAKVQELSGEDLIWGITSQETGTERGEMVDKATYSSEANIWYQLYLQERKHLVMVSAAALKAGIEERRVKLAEDQGHMVAGVVQRILAALNLTVAQQQLAPQVVSREFRALAALSVAQETNE